MTTLSVNTPLLGKIPSVSNDSSIQGNSSESTNSNDSLVRSESTIINSSSISDHTVVEIAGSDLGSADLNPQKTCIEKISETFKKYQPQIIFAMLLLVQITGIYPMDQLMRAGLNIQQVVSTGPDFNTSFSMQYPPTIIQKAVLAASFFFAELVLFASFLRVTSLNGLTNDYMRIKAQKEETPEKDLLAIAKNLTPSNLKIFVAYAAVALISTAIASYQLALDAEQFSWKADPKIGVPSHGSSDEIVSSISINQHNFLIFSEIALLSFRHLACALDGVYRSWGNKFAIIHSMGSASMLMDKITFFMDQKHKSNETVAS